MILGVLGLILLAIAAVEWWHVLTDDRPWHAPVTGSGYGFLWWVTGLGLGGLASAATAVELNRRRERRSDASVEHLVELRHRHPDDAPAASVAWHPRGVDGD